MTGQDDAPRLFDVPTDAGRYCQQRGLNPTEAVRIRPLWDAVTADGELVWSDAELEPAQEDRR
jgi:hypothetical protein